MLTDTAQDDVKAPDAPIFVVKPPFIQTPLSDAILRSSDGADFYVHRTILSIVSPVFETMFSLPQPATPAADDRDVGGVPVIEMRENSHLLDRALRFFYPGAKPPIETFDEFCEVLQVLLKKYDMQALVPVSKQRLEAYIPSASIAVYAVAVAYLWEDVARVAAKHSLTLQRSAILNGRPSLYLGNIPALAYHNLLNYHSRCGERSCKNHNSDVVDSSS